MERRKQEEKKQIDEKVKELEKSKKGVMKSVKGFFGFRTAEKENEEQKEVKKLQKDLDNDFMKKYEIEEERLNKEIEDFIDNKGTFDEDIVEEMPPEWVRFNLVLNVPETKFSLLKKDSTPENVQKILELRFLKVYLGVELGRTFENILFRLEKGDIIDFITEGESKPTYMFENISTESGSNAIEITVAHNSRDKVPVKISAMTQADFYIFLNVPCLKEVEMFFTSHLKHNKIDISYYAEQAKIQFLKYINRGIDYVETIDTEQVKMMNIELNIYLSSPVIFVRDPRAHIDRWIILNLGKIRMGTEFRNNLQMVKGQEQSVEVPIYRIGVTGFKLMNAVNLGDYKGWEEGNTSEVIDDVSLETEISYNYREPDALGPTLAINLEVSNVNLVLSDFLVLSTIEMLFGLQEAYNSHEDDAIEVIIIEETTIEMSEEEKT